MYLSWLNCIVRLARLVKLAMNIVSSAAKHSKNSLETPIPCHHGWSQGCINQPGARGLGDSLFQWNDGSHGDNQILLGFIGRVLTLRVIGVNTRESLRASHYLSGMDTSAVLSFSLVKLRAPAQELLFASRTGGPSIEGKQIFVIVIASIVSYRGVTWRLANWKSPTR